MAKLHQGILGGFSGTVGSLFGVKIAPGPKGRHAPLRPPARHDRRQRLRPLELDEGRSHLIERHEAVRRSRPHGHLHRNHRRGRRPDPALGQKPPPPRRQKRGHHQDIRLQRDPGLDPVRGHRRAPFPPPQHPPPGCLPRRPPLGPHPRLTKHIFGQRHNKSRPHTLSR